MKNALFMLAVVFGLAGCTTTPAAQDALKAVAINIDFETGAAASITRTADGFQIEIAPENTPINDSPWYAFEVTGAAGLSVPITLLYQGGTHRYSPKIQSDDGTWASFAGDLAISVDETTAQFTLLPTTDTLRVAAQPIINTADHRAWADALARLDYVDFKTIGQSVEGRAIYKLEEVDDPSVNKPYVVVIGRQHPPEVTGAQSLKPFVETIWGDSDLARRFRAEFNLIVIPVINPDGVARGHWRHNVGGIDLNRDWGPFSQPETQAVAREFTRFDPKRDGAAEDEIVLFLDFHSTWRNLIYTQLDSEPTTPAFFTRDWIANVKAALPDEIYSFTREANETAQRPISKNYMYHRYGIPAMTFEVGDNTPPEATDAASVIFAQEMMTLLLDGLP